MTRMAKPRKWSADRKAITRIAMKPRGRERAMYVNGDILLLDDGGGESVTSFTEKEALHYFLMWYRHRKAEQLAERKVSKRRAGFKIVSGGEK